MIFVRLEQVTQKCSTSEPFVFCKKCHAYYYGGRTGNFCSLCGHKFRNVTKPKMLTVTLDEEMSHEDALKYVKNKVFGKY